MDKTLNLLEYHSEEVENISFSKTTFMRSCICANMIQHRLDDGIRNSISAHSTKHRTPIINVAKTDGTGLLFVTRDFVFVGFVVDTLVLTGASGLDATCVFILGDNVAMPSSTCEDQTDSSGPHSWPGCQDS